MKNLITTEIINEVKDMLCNEACRISPYEFEDFTRISIGNIEIVRDGNTSYLKLPDDLPENYMKFWKEDVGKLLSKDMKKGIYSNIFLLETPEKKALLRKINECDEELCKEKGFDHITIGDFSYTILRLIPNEKGFNEIDYDLFDNEDLPSLADKMSLLIDFENIEDENDEPNFESLSLVDEDEEIEDMETEYDD